MKKGISPLIAAVVLIAFVIAVSVIVSVFFTDIAEEWGDQVSERDPINCAVASLSIDEGTWNGNVTDGHGNVTVYVEGSDLASVGLTVQDIDGNTEYTAHEPENEYFEEGHSYRLTGNSIPGEQEVEKLTLTTPDCPGVESSVEIEE